MQGAGITKLKGEAQGLSLKGTTQEEDNEWMCKVKKQVKAKQTSSSSQALLCLRIWEAHSNAASWISLPEILIQQVWGNVIEAAVLSNTPSNCDDSDAHWPYFEKQCVVKSPCHDTVFSACPLHSRASQWSYLHIFPSTEVNRCFINFLLKVPFL